MMNYGKQEIALLEQKHHEVMENIRNIVGDILPSFQLYESVYRRSSLEECEFPKEDPPNYIYTSNDKDEPHSNQENSGLYDNICVTGNSIMDDLDSLSIYEGSPVRISTSIIKELPTSLSEIPMKVSNKEFTSGDLITGYVIMDNFSTKSINFELFDISFQGKTTIYRDNRKFIKTFLKMNDLSAGSYSVHNMDIINYDMLFKFAGMRDFENCIIGVPKNHILQPQEIYKIYFTFRIPFKLLDSSCTHNLSSHVMLPPSFGVQQGLPKVCDYSVNGYAINYLISTSLVTKYAPGGKFRSFAILSQSNLTLRFVPFGVSQPLLYDMGSEMEFNKLIDSFTKHIDLKEQEYRKGDESGVMEYKEKITAKSHRSSIPLFPINEISSTDKIIFRQQLHFQKNINIWSKIIKRPCDYNGHMLVSSYIPRRPIPYMKSTKDQFLVDEDTDNVKLLKSALDEDEHEDLKAITLSLDFVPGHLDSRGSYSIPSCLSSIRLELVALTIKSESLIPIRLTSDYFIGEKKLWVSHSSKISNVKTRLSELDKNVNIDQYIIEAIHSLSTLTCEQDVLDVFKVVNYGFRQEVREGRTTEYSLTVDFEYLKNLDFTVLPTFQSCLLARLYCIRVWIEFEGFGDQSVDIPIRVRKA